MGKHELFLFKTGPRQGQSPLFNLGLKILTKLLEWGGRKNNVIKEKGESKLSRLANEVKTAPQLPETVET